MMPHIFYVLVITMSLVKSLQIFHIFKFDWYGVLKVMSSGYRSFIRYMYAM